MFMKYVHNFEHVNADWEPNLIYNIQAMVQYIHQK